VATTDQELLSDVQSLLAEPRDGGVTWPSGMWSQLEVVSYLSDSQLDLVATTALVLKRVTVGCITHLLRHDLPEDFVELVRIVWVRASDSRRFPLHRADIWELDAALFSGISNWRVEAGIPNLFTTGDLPTRTVQIAPAATVPGNLDVLYVAVPVALTGAGAAIEVPDDSTVALVWGTVQQALTKEGRAKDPARAQVAGGLHRLAAEAVRLILRGWVE
jgi:hypothetical protein